LVSVLRRHGFEIEALQADWTSEPLGIACDEVLRDIRLLTTSGPATTGATYAGADVYLYVARRIFVARTLMSAAPRLIGALVGTAIPALSGSIRNGDAV
jgi:hypothetical protein